MPSPCGHVCAAYRIYTSQELGLGSWLLEVAPCSSSPGVTFSGLCGTSAALFGNLHKPAKRSLGELSGFWLRATVPLVGPAKRKIMQLT